MVLKFEVLISMKTRRGLPSAYIAVRLSGKMIEILRPHRKRLMPLMAVSLIVAWLAGQDAYQSTVRYNHLDWKSEAPFKITGKYNKAEGDYFPDLNFKGEELVSRDTLEIKVSKGDFDSHEIGQTIKVFKTKSNQYMTEYEINNMGIIPIGDFGVSFAVIPSAIFLIVGLFSLVVIIRTRK